MKNTTVALLTLRHLTLLTLRHLTLLTLRHLALLTLRHLTLLTLRQILHTPQFQQETHIMTITTPPSPLQETPTEFSLLRTLTQRRQHQELRLLQPPGLLQPTLEPGTLTLHRRPLLRLLQLPLNQLPCMTLSSQQQRLHVRRLLHVLRLLHVRRLYQLKLERHIQLLLIRRMIRILILTKGTLIIQTLDYSETLTKN